MHPPNRPASSLRNTSFGRATNTGTIDPISGLHAVLQEGYVVQIGTDEFKWSHDRITQAATELIKPKLRQKIHFKIAQHLMQGKEKNLFTRIETYDQQLSLL